MEGLLNRLANYMAGEIPDTDDLTELFSKNKDIDQSMTDGIDDATTDFTKDEPALQRLQSYPQISLEPIYGPPDYGKKPNQVDADDNLAEPPDPDSQPSLD